MDDAERIVAEALKRLAPKKANGQANDKDKSWREGAFTAAELQGMKFAPVSWAVPNIIPAEGVTLLASKPKFGKSWLAYDLCIGSTMDRYILGDIKPRQGDVLYLALEDSKRRLQRRMDKLLPTFAGKWPARLTLKIEWRRLHEGGLEDIRDWHVETSKNGGKPTLVVIDVLAKVRKPTGNRPAYEADYEALTGLAQLAHELAIAIVVIHHVRKMAADDQMEMVSGTFAITGAVDTVLVMATKASGAILDVRGRDVESAEMAVEFDKPTCRWRILGNAAEVHASQQEMAVLAALKDAGHPLEVKEIEVATAIKRASLDTVLLRMAAKDLITKVGRGVYALPEWNPPSGPGTKSYKSDKSYKSPKSLSDSQAAQNLEENGQSYNLTNLTAQAHTKTMATGGDLSALSMSDLSDCKIHAHDTEIPRQSPRRESDSNLTSRTRAVRLSDSAGPSEFITQLDGNPVLAKVTIREIRVPPIAAGPDDDIYDIDPGWRQ